MNNEARFEMFENYLFCVTLNGYREVAETEFSHM